MTAIAARYVRARKQHRCDICRHAIKPDEVYLQSKTPPSDEFWPGHWNTWRTHDGVCPR
jgi:hypothetical protein